VLNLGAPGSISAALETGAAVCLMHMQGCPQTMQAEPHYDDVVSEVRGFLEQRIAECRAAGIGRGRLCVDPGIGFGKRLNHNVDLLAHTGLLLGLECPILIGASRKSMFGELLGRPLADRLPASLAAAAIAVLNGAAIVRTHDVRATTDAIRVAYALRTSQGMR
jgi:dihydropteroate synthase